MSKTGPTEKQQYKTKRKPSNGSEYKPDRKKISNSINYWSEFHGVKFDAKNHKIMVNLVSNNAQNKKQVSALAHGLVIGILAKLSEGEAFMANQQRDLRNYLLPGVSKENKPVMRLRLRDLLKDSMRFAR